MTAWSDFAIRKIDGNWLDMAALQPRVVLWVNTASACGFTPQLKALQQLHDRWSDRGLMVVGSPCNQFGGQDPHSNENIAAFCQKNYGVNFTLTEKIKVNGRDTHPVFQWLKKEAPGLLGSQAIKWNFTKFLISRNCQVLRRFAPNQDPIGLTADIERALTDS